MKNTMVIMVLISFSALKATVEPPEGCTCYDDTATNPCYDAGCSHGTNPFCSDGSFDAVPVNHGVIYYNPHNTYDFYTGCNCPYTFVNSSYNGYYPAYPNGYKYSTCTDYGVDAHDGDNISADANNAIECCNFCCGRDDPSITTTTTVTQTTYTGNGRKIMLCIPLCLSGLTVLVLIALRIY